MFDALTLVTGVAALLLAAWCGWAAYRDQPTKDWHFIGMAVVSVLALVQLVIGIVQLARGEKPEQERRSSSPICWGRSRVCRRRGSCRSRSGRGGDR